MPVRGPEKIIRRDSLRPMLVSTIAARRNLTLIQLHSHAELIETEARQYSRTAAWAAALHTRLEGADGLVWVSRKFNTSFALVLFGDRVDRSDLEVVDPPLPLFLGAGYAEVQRVAEQAGITILD